MYCRGKGDRESESRNLNLSNAACDLYSQVGFVYAGGLPRITNK